MKTIFLMVFVLVSPSQANLWGSNTESWLVGEQHQTACRAAGETVAVAQRRLWSPGTAYKLPWAWMGSTDWWILGKKWSLNFFWSLLCHYCGFISDMVTFEWSAGSVTQVAREIPRLSSVSWLSHSEQLMLGMPTCPSSAGPSMRLHKFGYIARCFFPSSLCICSLCYQASLLKH